MQDALVFTRTKHRANRLAKFLGEHGHQGRTHSREPFAGPAHRGAGRLQERQVSRAGRHRYRRARHRRHCARPCRQFRRAAGARGLHSPRRPNRPRRNHRFGIHLDGAGGRGQHSRHREGDQQPAAARDAAGLRLSGARPGAAARSASAPTAGLAASAADRMESQGQRAGWRSVATRVDRRRAGRGPGHAATDGHE